MKRNRYAIYDSIETMESIMDSIAPTVRMWRTAPDDIQMATSPLDFKMSRLERAYLTATLNLWHHVQHLMQALKIPTRFRCDCSH